MGSRRLPIKAIVAGLVAVLAVAGGIALALVATDDDGSADGATPEVVFGSPPDQDPPPADPPTVAQRPDQAPGTTDPQQPAQEPDLQQPAVDPTPGGGRTTTFPRERAQREPDDPVQRRFAVPPAQRFSGTGNARLGNVNIKQTSLVKWSTSGRFELRFGREAFPITAPSEKGQLVVPAYNFTQVRVIASGPWRISIIPQK
jgi:hypothetical protein